MFGKNSPGTYLPTCDRHVNQVIWLRELFRIFLALP